MTIKASTIIKAVTQAKKELRDLLITVQLNHKTGSSYTSGTNTPTYSTTNVTAAYDKFTFEELQDNQVRSTDAKMILFLDDVNVVPETDDLIVDGSNSYQVIKPDVTYVKSRALVATVRIRK